MRRFLLPALATGVVLGTFACGSGPSPGPATGPPPPAPGATATPGTSVQRTTDPAVIASRVTVPVLCFHQVRDWRPSDSRADRQIITPPAVLEEQFDVLADNGFTPISDDALYDHLTAGTPLPPKPILLTFDDGTESQPDTAAPALARRGWPGTFFVMTVVIGKKGWITGDEIRRLASSGATVGSHTYDHNAVSGYTADDVGPQLVEPRKLLSRLAGRPVIDFAYPYGSWRTSSLPKVRDAGYRMAFGLDTPVDPSDPLRSYPRVLVPPTWTEAQLLAEIAKAARPTTNDAGSGGA